MSMTRADIIMRMLENTPELTKKLMEMRDLLPGVNISLLVSRFPDMFLDIKIPDLKAKLELMRWDDQGVGAPAASPAMMYDQAGIGNVGTSASMAGIIQQQRQQMQMQQQQMQMQQHGVMASMAGNPATEIMQQQRQQMQMQQQEFMASMVGQAKPPVNGLLDPSSSRSTFFGSSTPDPQQQQIGGMGDLVELDEGGSPQFWGEAPLQWGQETPCTPV
eukprot:gene25765-11428_t